MVRKVQKKSPAKKVEKPVRVQPKRDTKSPKKGSPAKKVAAAPARRKKAKYNHPPYMSMIKKAIKAHDTNYVSGIAICKFIEANYKVAENFRRYVNQALKREVEKGVLTQVRHSFRLSKSKKAHKPGTRKSPRKKEATSESEEEEEKEVKPKRGRPAKKVANAKKEAEASPKKRGRKPKKEADKKEEKKEKTESPKRRGRKPNKEAASESNSEASASPVKKTTKSKRGAKPRALFGGGAEEGGDTSTSVADSKYDNVWQYYDHGWKNYATEASDTVEEVYLNYKQNRGGSDIRAVKSGQWEYLVDFMQMKQTNTQHPNHTVRDIRRVENKK